MNDEIEIDEEAEIELMPKDAIESMADWWNGLPKTSLKEWEPEQRLAYVKESLKYLPDLIGMVKDRDRELQDLSNKVILAEQRIEELAKASDESGVVSPDAVYRERNMCIAGLARLAIRCGYRAGRIEYEADDGSDEKFQHVVIVELPTGQVSWHVKDRELKYFRFLPIHEAPRQANSKEEKYKRIDELFSYMNFK